MMRAYLIGAGLLLAVSPAAAQDNSNIEGEVVVTAQRASADYLSDEQTVVGLRRTADSAIQPVQFTSDSRDEDMRKREIHAMLEAAIRRDVSLVLKERILQVGFVLLLTFAAIVIWGDFGKLFRASDTRPAAEAPAKPQAP